MYLELAICWPSRTVGNFTANLVSSRYLGMLMAMEPVFHATCAPFVICACAKTSNGQRARSAIDIMDDNEPCSCSRKTIDCRV